MLFVLNSPSILSLLFLLYWLTFEGRKTWVKYHSLPLLSLRSRQWHANQCCRFWKRQLHFLQCFSTVVDAILRKCKQIHATLEKTARIQNSLKNVSKDFFLFVFFWIKIPLAFTLSQTFDRCWRILLTLNPEFLPIATLKNQQNKIALSLCWLITLLQRHLCKS